MLTSDTPLRLPPQRLKLWALLRVRHPDLCMFPLLSQSASVYKRYFSDGVADDRLPSRQSVIVQVRRTTLRQLADVSVEFASVLLFNPDHHSRQCCYSVQELGCVSAVYIYDWLSDNNVTLPAEILPIALLPYESKLLFVCSVPMDTLVSALTFGQPLIKHGAPRNHANSDGH
jgi:hypothetical protein